MVPILALAGAALLLALYKWRDLSSLRNPSQKQINALLNAVAQHDKRRPCGGQRHRRAGRQMLAAGVGASRRTARTDRRGHVRNGSRPRASNFRDCCRLCHQRLVCAAARAAGNSHRHHQHLQADYRVRFRRSQNPVQWHFRGAHHHRVRSVYGDSLAATVRLPFRKARGVIDQMEKAAIAFTNQVSKTPYERINNAVKSDE